MNKALISTKVFNNKHGTAEQGKQNNTYVKKNYLLKIMINLGKKNVKQCRYRFSYSTKNFYGFLNKKQKLFI